MLVPARRHDPEWLDREDNAPHAVEGALRDIRLVNRFLGGERTLLAAAAPLIAAAPPGTTVDVLDVGTGSGDLPASLVALGESLGRQVNVVALDRDPIAARVAASGNAQVCRISVVRADAFRLPFPPRSFDLVTASMFLHHFAHDDAVRLLRGFRAVARVAVVVNDLRRHLFPWAFIAAAGRLTFRHPMFVHDAPLSVLRGFTAEELLAAGRAAAGGSARIDRRWPFRLLLTLPAERTPA